MNYILKPTLDHIAMVNLATILWNQPDVRYIISTNCKLPAFEKTFSEIEDKVKEKVPLLPVPKLLREKILTFIKPIGLQIFRWILYHCYSNLKIDLPQEFYWTSHGTIDCKRTAEILAKDQNIAITKRYRLSCIYCFENNVRELWSQMHEDCRKGFDNQNQHALVVFWTNIMKEKATSASRNARAFRDASYFDNAVATKYFIQKLTYSEKLESLVQTAVTISERCIKFSDHSYGFIRGYDPETLCFLLSNMEDEQQMKVFEKAPLEVLLCLLDWPWHFFLKETVSVVMDFLDGKAFNIFLIEITEWGLKCFNCQEIFREVWQRSPDALKRYVFNDADIFTRKKFIVNLFKLRDESSIKLVLNDATPLEKLKIIDSFEGSFICMGLVLYEEWDLLEYFIRECITTKAQIIDFQVSFERTMLGYSLQADTLFKTDKLSKCSQLLKDILCEYIERNEDSCVEERSAKRFCCAHFL